MATNPDLLHYPVSDHVRLSVGVKRLCLVIISRLVITIPVPVLIFLRVCVGEAMEEELGSENMHKKGVNQVPSISIFV